MSDLGDAGDTPNWGDVRPVGTKAEEGEDARTFGQRDSDRVLYAPEFRRLAGVTQVISPQADFVFHDRLTHSLKVAQVARRLAEQLRSNFLKENSGFDEANLLLDGDVCYTAALAHDLGHPPFGHAAETALQDILKKKLGEDPHNGELLNDSFEGNAQTFRIVSKLSFRKEDEPGLNLSWRTLAAISKYPWQHGNERTTRGDKPKWGFYNTEAAYESHLAHFGYIRPHGDDDDILQSLEAQIMDWADDIAYAVHDLDDFYRTGMIPLNLLGTFNESEDWDDIKRAGITSVRNAIRKAELDDEALDTLVDELRVVLSVRKFDGSARAQEALRELSSELIRQLSSDCSVQLRDGSGKPYLHITVEGRARAAFLKSITQWYVLGDSSVELMQVGQTRVVRELFTELWTIGKKHYSSGTGKRRRPLPERFQHYLMESLRLREFDVYGGPERKLARATVDFMCTLTDQQASLLHQRLTGDSVGPLPNYWLRV
ncbi:dGTP triphosphohydrolase [Frigoribacterium sp. CFBP 8751]|uniref:dGTP triphosphohydrolase n=1 Tax=Frigoribacterium sp. CFBP 8751 TaxID=2775277 RepID=UPI001780D8D7|nr:dNTP triphosphohydrolase [Frigoribacterium sp. CFBP 8751]